MRKKVIAEKVRMSGRLKLNLIAAIMGSGLTKFLQVQLIVQRAIVFQAILEQPLSSVRDEHCV
ncbi:hypothetical protein CDL15_Pgr019282 [Punica granatum]|uniref:Uncharacterized protein n=1 Tax=Punica granatum TaxID=22663 RepID=A0A218XPU2_PUNGR|nr:hypothetical protein CDL15_Pgr019282 [Punica granatum]